MKKLLFAFFIVGLIAALASCSKEQTVKNDPLPAQDLMFSVDFKNMSQISTSTPWQGIKHD